MVCVGDTQRSIKARFNEHPRPCSTTSVAVKHIHVQSVSCPVYPAFDVGDRPHWT